MLTKLGRYLFAVLLGTFNILRRAFASGRLLISFLIFSIRLLESSRTKPLDRHVTWSEEQGRLSHEPDQLGRHADVCKSG